MKLIDLPDLANYSKKDDVTKADYVSKMAKELQAFFKEQYVFKNYPMNESVFYCADSHMIKVHSIYEDTPVKPMLQAKVDDRAKSYEIIRSAWVKFCYTGEGETYLV